MAKNKITIDEIVDWYGYDGMLDDLEVLISKYKPFLREQKLKDLLG